MYWKYGEGLDVLDKIMGTSIMSLATPKVEKHDEQLNSGIPFDRPRYNQEYFKLHEKYGEVFDKACLNYLELLAYNFVILDRLQMSPDDFDFYHKKFEEFSNQVNEVSVNDLESFNNIEHALSYGASVLAYGDKATKQGLLASIMSAAIEKVDKELENKGDDASK